MKIILSKFVVSFLFIANLHSLKAQDTIVLQYRPFIHQKVNGRRYIEAEKLSAYIIGKDYLGRKRIEGRINSDLGDYIGEVIEYYGNGNKKSVKLYDAKVNGGATQRSGVWKYFRRDGTLSKEVNNN